MAVDRAPLCRGAPSPLRDHVTAYYVYLPLIGICWLGGWAFAEAWRSAVSARLAAALVLLYALMAVPGTLRFVDRNYRLSLRVRGLVEGLAAARELHPHRSILLDGVDTDLFWNGVVDRPFRLIGIPDVYLSPGSERHIDAHPDWGDVNDFLLPPDAVALALERGELVVYDVRGPRLRNITVLYTPVRQDPGLPLRIDAASPVTSYLLGPEWYARESGTAGCPGAPPCASPSLPAPARTCTCTAIVPTSSCATVP